MFISNKEKESIRREFNNLWNNISILEKARQNLFKKDHHGTVRPKVDILAEDLVKVNTNMWIEVNKLNDKIEKLERKCSLK